MDEHQIGSREKVAKHLIKNLTKKHMEASYAPTAAQAKKEVLDMIPDGATVYKVGSMSLVEMGLWDDVAKKPGVNIIDPLHPDLKPEEGMTLRVKGLTADYLITSSNAITLDGKIVNLDGSGNRVAAICFGPKKVILVIGMNKVTPDLDTAMSRVKHLASPINAIRLKLKTPCVETGRCHDCDSPERICNMWSIVEGHRLHNRIHVKLVGEDLGY
jgi:L-lactate utilization protein LutB